MLGQTVLLAGVNDSETALGELLSAPAVRVKPCYLRQLDAAPGTARFHVPEPKRSREILYRLHSHIIGSAYRSIFLIFPTGWEKFGFRA